MLFGAHDPAYCTQLGLAVHVEHYLRMGQMEAGNATQSLFGIAKSRASDALKAILDDESFPRVDGKPLGMHSIHKLPATYAQRNGFHWSERDSNPKP